MIPGAAQNDRPAVDVGLVSAVAVEKALALVGQVSADATAPEMSPTALFCPETIYPPMPYDGSVDPPISEKNNYVISFMSADILPSL